MARLTEGAASEPGVCITLLGAKEGDVPRVQFEWVSRRAAAAAMTPIWSICSRP